MALEYTLKLVTTLSPHGALGVLSKYGFDFQEISGLRSVFPGGTVAAADETELGRALIKEAYNLNPTIYLNFRLDKFEDWETGLKTILKACLELLRVIGADGILMFNGETPVLLNRDGRITLNSMHGFWDRPDLLSIVDVPYEMHNLSTL